MSLTRNNHIYMKGSYARKLCQEAMQGSYARMLCQEVHSRACEAFLESAHSGKPRYDFLFDSMRRRRAQFKLLLRQNVKVKDALAKRLLSKLKILRTSGKK